MTGLEEGLAAHLQSGRTTLCRAWAVTRKDGVVFGFTDHDLPLEFEGLRFEPDSGLTALALAQGTGLSVDNTEALGVLSDARINETDIEAGRYDGAEVRCWLVNWSQSDQRALLFRGTIGELRRSGGAFEAELRGQTEALNRPIGRVYQKPCTAVLGDNSCRFDLDAPGYSVEIDIETLEEGRLFVWEALPGFEPEWFARGRLDVLSGEASGLWGAIKRDLDEYSGRKIELWEPLRAPLVPGDRVRLTAGCDKRLETCRLKFDNILNFQGFPDIPGEDWLMAYPKPSGPNSGGSLR